jgi:hypothetical protein
MQEIKLSECNSVFGGKYEKYYDICLNKCHCNCDAAVYSLSDTDLIDLGQYQLVEEIRLWQLCRENCKKECRKNIDLSN